MEKDKQKFIFWNQFLYVCTCKRTGNDAILWCRWPRLLQPIPPWSRRPIRTAVRGPKASHCCSHWLWQLGSSTAGLTDWTDGSLHRTQDQTEGAAFFSSINPSHKSVQDFKALLLFSFWKFCFLKGQSRVSTLTTREAPCCSCSFLSCSLQGAPHGLPENSQLSGKTMVSWLSLSVEMV